VTPAIGLGDASIVPEEAKVIACSCKKSFRGTVLQRSVRASKAPAQPTAAAFEIGEDAVPSLGTPRIETLFEEALVIHAGSRLFAVTEAAGKRWLPDRERVW
jgi:hypothetical protein